MLDCECDSDGEDGSLRKVNRIHRAKRDYEPAIADSRFLAEAALLSSNFFDPRSVLAAVTQICVDQYADWGSACLVDQNLELCQVGAFVAATSVGPGPPPDHSGDNLDLLLLWSGRKVLHRVSRGKPIRFERFGTNWIDEITEGVADAAFFREAAVYSALCLPISFGGRLLALLTLFLSTPHRKFSSRTLLRLEMLSASLAFALAVAGWGKETLGEVPGDADRPESTARAAAMLSHEVRNSVAAIISWTKYLKGRSVIIEDPGLSQAVRAVQRNAELLARLNERYLDTSRTGAGLLESIPLDVHEVLSSCIEDLAGIAHAKGLSIHKECTNRPAWLFGDPFRLQQVFANVIINAIKYTPAGGSVTISCRSDNEHAQVEIRDTGSGIDPDQLREIFLPFRRGRDALLRQETGLGLGLAIAEQIVTLHKGTIWADSKGRDCGSTFYIRIPLSSAQCGRVKQKSQQVQEEPVRILLVEDATDVLAVTKMELEALGHIVLPAENGIEAIETAGRERPDLIISDIHVPGVDGCEMLERIRANAEIASIPAIALTGSSDESNENKAKAAGFATYLLKPAETQVLDALIRSLVKKQSSVSQVISGS
ncbi:MAG: response regulator [Acidobacteriaceae bacterium]|nr:response regulator [Acidobacteriaceae bacterium]